MPCRRDVGEAGGSRAFEIGVAPGIVDEDVNGFQLSCESFDLAGIGAVDRSRNDVTLDFPGSCLEDAPAPPGDDDVLALPCEAFCAGAAYTGSAPSDDDCAWHGQSLRSDLNV
ncbi:hypothetical protein JCM18882A_27840 [Brevibacterium metallidurans]|uniref:Uncharacterized protein n=1 Tax=Brevibacterium metallidurans TaxID=1482676 RepID=A0ABN0SRV6_9MICO